MNKNIEMRIYELVGIKTFKKMVFNLLYILVYPYTYKMTKEERTYFIHNLDSNYTIGENKNIQKVIKFKKMLLLNASIHSFLLLLDSVRLINIINSNPSALTLFNYSFSLIINSYCIMLQRYNYIRINRLIKKATPIYEHKKQLIKEKLKNKDLNLDNSYTILNKKKLEKEVSLNELIENASL